MTAVAWRSELKYAALYTLGLTVVGLLVGELGWMLIVGLFAYLARHIWQIHILEKWLRTRPQKVLPDGNGVWGEIFGRLQWQQRLRRRRKRRIAGMLGRFRHSSDAMPDAVVILNADDEIEWFNKASVQTFGLRRRRDIGRPITDFVRSPDFVRFLGAGNFEQAIAIRSPRSSPLILSIRIVRFGGDQRLLLARDVTDMHRVDQIRRDFVANVSHELRSPLTVIRGYVETMLQDPKVVPETWRKPLLRIEEQSVRLTRLVEDLLQLSKIESDPKQAITDPVDVGQILSGAIGDASVLRDGPCHIVLDAEPGLFLLGDAKLLYSAFSNLIFNAVQYTTASDSITVRWYVQRDAGVVSVEDTGVGIEAEHLPRLTERFYRVDEARSQDLGGTGLGLAIVKHVLMRHGAELKVQSELGVGSKFSCHFPAQRTRSGYSSASPPGA